MENKAYGVYSGCIHEGGGCDNNIYLDKENARKECLRRVEEENKQFTEWNKQDGGYDFALYTERQPDYWQCAHDCICIQEFDIKD